MPFTPTGGGMYKSPSGRTFNKAQVKLYYSLGGHFPGEKGAKKYTKKKKTYKMKTI